MIAKKEIVFNEIPSNRILKVDPSRELSPLAKRRIKTIIAKWAYAQEEKKQKYVIKINKVIISENAAYKFGIPKGVL